MYRKGQGVAIVVGLIAVVGVASFFVPGLAASESAWEDFREDVAAKCIAAAHDGDFATAMATVDPFGSESFGLALIEGRAEGSGQLIASICVYDKETTSVELGGELPR